MKTKEKSLIKIREGKYKRVSQGINFFIENTQFFAVRMTRYEKPKDILKVSYFDEEKGKRAVHTLSGLKPIKGTNNEYYFDVQTPSLRGFIDADKTFYKLVVHSEQIEIKGDC